MLSDFLSLFYPETCVSCSNGLLKHETEICSRCFVTLPKSGFHLDKENPVARLFHGRTDVQMAGSYYLFTKSGSVQKILHQLKYKGNREVGITLGKWYGDDLKNVSEFANTEMIIPVPLHKNRFKKRGYNQSTCFANGLSQILTAKVREDILVRKAETETQTRKGRFDRWENVSDKFGINNEAELRNKHVLLVDDVITTGATLEACIQELKKVEGVKVSVATIAYAQQI